MVFDMYVYITFVVQAPVINVNNGSHRAIDNTPRTLGRDDRCTYTCRIERLHELNEAVLSTPGSKFGTTTNSKGYKLLPPYLRVIQVCTPVPGIAVGLPVATYVNLTFLGKLLPCFSPLPTFSAEKVKIFLDMLHSLYVVYSPFSMKKPKQAIIHSACTV